ncbi:hypothetical protein [Aquiflexum sp.]|uniref:hypothetical protein n=1 Tax=Aquiflexum sp. TaxID=1872584 RepID=UPI003594245C
MNKLTFEIQTHKDFYKKLIEEYKDFLNQPLSSRHAINFSMTAYHLIEWIYHDDNETKPKTLNDFRQEIKDKCPEMQIVHDIATGGKHYKLWKHNPKTENTKLKGGTFSRGFSKAFNISLLKVEMKDGQIMDFEDVAKTIMTFWDSYYKEE